MADEYAWPRSIEHKTRGGDVGLEGCFRFLNDIHGVAVVFENVCNGLPAGTVGERAMDNNNILDPQHEPRMSR